jgi:tetratricopeptide (TPR) repeat protein
MQAFSMKSTLSAVVALGAAVALSPVAGHAMGDPPKPKPKVDCTKAENKGKAECKQKKSSNTDETYSAGYLLAKAGKFEEAIKILKTADDQSDPRILNYLGFSSRKLGDVDTALGYYTRALATNPNYTVARAYMGEAFLQKGDAAKAKEQLAEIEKRCGRACAEFAELDGHIKNFEKTGSHSG